MTYRSVVLLFKVMKPARCRSPVPAPKMIQYLPPLWVVLNGRIMYLAGGMPCCEVCASRYLGHICKGWSCELQQMRFLFNFFFHWCIDREETLQCSVDNIILVFMSSLVQYSAGVPSAGGRKRKQCISLERGDSEWGKSYCNPGKLVHLAGKRQEPVPLVTCHHLLK